jgi:recombination protein RecA
MSSPARSLVLPPGVSLGPALVSQDARRRVVSLAGPVGDALPDGGFPRGAVTELAAPAALGRGTSVALASIAAAQAEARARGGESAWCAWLDAGGTLFAPAVAAAGVDLARLLVVRPTAAALARVAARVAGSGVFSVLVVDVSGTPGAAQDPGGSGLGHWARAVRRVALGVEGTDTAVVLLTDALAARPAPLPVAMRVELERSGAHRLALRVAKERSGRVSAPRDVAWTRPGARAFSQDRTA